MKITKSNIGWGIIVFLLLIGAAEMQTIFQTIKITGNPGIVFSNTADSISNRTAGTLVFNSMIKAKGFIADTNTVPLNVAYTSSGFTLNTYRKTSPTVQGAIDMLDSGTVYIGPGVYGERVTLKSKVTLIGAGTNRTIIVRTDDSCVVYGNRISNVQISDLSIKNVYSTDLAASRTGVKIRKAFTDSLTTPTIVLRNVVIDVKDDDDVYALWLDSACAVVTQSSLTEDGDNCAVIYMQNGSKVYPTDNKLINRTGNPQSSIFYALDTRCRVTFSYNRILTGYVIFHVSTANMVVRANHNMSDISVTDIDNGAVILAVNSSNSFDINYTFPWL